MYVESDTTSKNSEVIPRNLTPGEASIDFQDNPSELRVRTTSPTLSKKIFELKTEFPRSNAGLG